MVACLHTAGVSGLLLNRASRTSLAAVFRRGRKECVVNLSAAYQARQSMCPKIYLPIFGEVG